MYNRFSRRPPALAVGKFSRKAAKPQPAFAREAVAIKKVERARRARFTVELSGARAAVRAWHFIPHASAPAKCLAAY
jgi:hypothetical protein